VDFDEIEYLRDFRREASTWITDTLSRDPVGQADTQEEKERRARWWQDECLADGWVGLSWPTEYAGRGLTSVHEAIFNAEALAVGAPLPINFLAQIMVGPALLAMGTEGQKAAYLPKILTAEEIWCIGFSEPGSGSDLASLRTRASHIDGSWQANGQKVWTSWAHIADRCLLLTRTDPSASAHGGLTMLLAPMAQAQVRPLRMINDEYDFNEVYFDDVLVAETDVLGDVGGGWKVALAVLGFERRAIPLILHAEAERQLKRLIAQVTESGLAADVTVSENLARIWADIESLRVSTLRCLAELAAGKEPGPQQLTLKLHWAQTSQRLTRYALSLAMSGRIDHAEHWSKAYLRARANSIESGTDEILLSIIAEQVLELPRSR
jgi:alkylation response protein AidB-like acyl-CoA dehydrogenase